MMKWLLVPLALLCSAVSFPAMMWKDEGTRRLPYVSTIPPDTFPRIWEPGRWYHDMKNLTTELVRADAQWWSKFLPFVIGGLCLAVLYLGVR